MATTKPPESPEEPRDVSRRQTSTCSDSQYITPIGLRFQQSCGQDFNGDPGALGSTSEASLNDCMIACSTYRPLCYAVSYTFASGNCTFYKTSAALFDLTSNSQVDVAVADTNQLQAPTNLTCPYNNLSTVASQEGEQFQIICGKYLPASADYCADNFVSCHPHTDSLEECIEMCSQSHPLCKGVSWNPDITQGYGNCYLKNDPFSSPPASSASNAFIFRSAEITPEFATDIDISCPDNTTYISENGKDFTINCWDGRIGSDNITSIHETSVTDCMEACATVTNFSCIGVVFDIAMQSGFENCYLLNATGIPNSPANATFAQLVQNVPQPSQQSEPQKSSIKPWVAGPIIGGVVLLAMAIAIYWWRYRKHRTIQVQDRTMDDRKTVLRIAAEPSKETAAEMPINERLEIGDGDQRNGMPQYDDGNPHMLQDPRSERSHELAA